VPTEIADAAFTTFSTTPAWYSALPSDLKAYYDGNNAKVQSVVNELAGVTGSATVGGSASRTGASAPKSTAAASNEKVVQYLGVGAAAAMVGVFAL
jgi:hypothetical protein